MITISPGHWVTGGAVDLLNEVTEARKVVNRVIAILRAAGVTTNHVEDNISKNQQQNLAYLVKQHNATNRKLDVSVHLNSSARKVQGIGVEVLYYDAKLLSAKVSAAIAKAGEFIDRGAKERKELAFLNGTHKPAILIEVCFVSSETDAKLYRKNFEAICQAIAKELAAYLGKSVPPVAEDKKEEVKMVQLLNDTGRKEIRGLLKKARNKTYIFEGKDKPVIDPASHTDAKIDAYTDVQLLSYQAAVINRTF